MKNIFLKFILLVIASTQLFAENIPLSSNRANPNAPALGYRDFPNNNPLNTGQSWPSYPSNYATSFSRDMYLGLIWSSIGPLLYPMDKRIPLIPYSIVSFPLLEIHLEYIELLVYQVAREELPSASWAMF